MAQADLEWKDDLQCTPLHLACKKGSYEALELLLQSGANIYAQDHRLWNPLHYASYNGHAKLVNKLVKWEADNDVLKEMRSSQEKLPFHIAKDDQVKKAFSQIWRACKDGDLDLVRILIREGQQVNEQTQKFKNTSIHIASKHGHILIVKFLISQGAQLNIANAYGQSALDIAQESVDLISKQVFDSKNATSKLMNRTQQL